MIDENGINSYNENDKLHGIVVNSDNFSKLEFYYQGDYRGYIGQLGGTVFLQPENNSSLVVGNYNHTTYARGNWNFEQATVSNLSIKYG